MIESSIIGSQGSNPKPAERIFAGRYFGPNGPDYTARGVREVEIMLENLVKFDHVLHGQLELALQAGRSEVVVLDIGSGEGELFADFLRNPKVGKKSRAFLGAHPEFKVRMLGLTDSPDAESHLREKPVNINEDKLDNESKRLKEEQLEIKNVYYTLTRTQTLEKFLQAQGVETVDFALATCSLMCFSPKVYEEVLQTTVAKMRKGGKFVASLIAPSIYDTFPTSYVDSLTTYGMPLGDAARKWLIYVNTCPRSVKNVAKYAKYPQDIKDERRALEAAWKTYERIGVLTEADIAQARGAMEINVDGLDFTEREKFYVLANITLAGAFARLVSRKDEEFWQKASAVINNLKGITGDVLSYASDETPKAIVFTKTE